MIVYLHGFGSTGNSDKVDALKSRFGKDNVISPDLPFDPLEVCEMVDNIVKDFYKKRDSDDCLIFVGTSLGAFYANYFGHLYDCPVVLVNPSVYPNENLRSRLGVNQNYVTKEEFLVSIAHLEELGKMRSYIEQNYSGNLVNLFVARDDDVIPYHYSLEVYKFTNTTYITETGGHRYDKNWNLVVDKIAVLCDA